MLKVGKEYKCLCGNINSGRPARTSSIGQLNLTDCVVFVDSYNIECQAFDFTITISNNEHDSRFGVGTHYRTARKYATTEFFEPYQRSIKQQVQELVTRTKD